ncbi:unnamed protein product [Prunus armeniaca]|uniref:Histone acetyltransferase n=1 Tax=Prunus armeniaca TaxID=36596 RepID=A0A6J5UGJ3_PRUAR|nr:unnamed protein product [Prunus armeniaca]
MGRGSSSPIDVVDPSWELYVLRSRGKQISRGKSTICCLVLQLCIVFTIILIYSSRLRIGQILVLPPYQHKGFGRYLLEVFNDVAISENVYALTVEEPLNYFQHVRTCVDVLRLHKFDPIKHAVSSAVSQLKQGKLSKKTHSSTHARH